MKKEELEHIMEDILRDAKSLLLRDGHIAPIAFMNVGNIMHIIGLNFKNSEEKDKQIFILALIAKVENANALIVVTESWYVTSDKPLEVEPSKHPMRKECIFIVGECEEDNITLIQKFDREKDKDGDKIIFGEIDNMDISGFFRFNFGIKNRKKDDKDILEHDKDKDTLKHDINDLKSDINAFKSSLN